LTTGNTVGSINQVGRGVQVQKIDNMFSQGSFESSESVTDLAIQGDSFFVLGDTSSLADTQVIGIDARYTRAGSFRITPDAGKPADMYLTNPDGLRVLDQDGIPIRFTTGNNDGTDFVKVTSIDPQGRIIFLRTDNTTAYYDGDPGGTTSKGTIGGSKTMANAKMIGTLNITGKGYIEKNGGTVFRVTSPTSGVPNTFIGHAPYDPTAAGPYTEAPLYCATFDRLAVDAAGTVVGKELTEKLFSSSLEQSNVDMGAQFVKMMVTQRAYSANSKSIVTADEMTQELLNLKR
jgi:flagellar hook protein FlgE